MQLRGTSPVPREIRKAADSDNKMQDIYDRERREMQFIALGVFGFLSIPLGLFVPLYLGTNPSGSGEATMLAFMIASHLISFQVS